MKNVNNVVPMCKFGCDELFERGYIVVLDGVVEVLKPNNTDTINTYLEKIKGNICNSYSEKNKLFFEWHYTHHNK